MLVNSTPFGAKASDSLRAIGMALQQGWIESCLPTHRPWNVSFGALRIKRIPRHLHAAGLALHLPIAPHIDTHRVMEVRQPSPRNTKSRIPPAQQLEIWNAAEAKRARKELQRMIDAGDSISEEL